MKLVYKQAQKEDIECIYDLSKHLVDEYENIENIDYEKVMNWIYEKIQMNIADYTCIYLDDNKVGYVHFSEEDGMHEIDDLYIFEAYQNQGIGTQVIQDCITQAKNIIYLYVFVRNIRAVDLYKRIGFKITETIRNSRYIMKYIK